MSATSTKPAVAEFDNVTVSAAVNLGPVISAGADQSLAANQVTLQATTSDDARPDPSTSGYDPLWRPRIWCGSACFTLPVT
jgi:hypothetical protein